MSAQPSPGASSASSANFKPTRRSKVLASIAIIIGLAFFLIPIVISNYTDWLWFRDLEYQGVFLKAIITRVVLFLIFGVLGALITWLAAFAAYRSGPSELESFSTSSPLAELRPSIKKNTRPMLFGLPLLVGLVSGMIAQGNWRTALMFVNGSSFGETDPQFGKDLGFYAFNLPMLTMILSTVSLLLILAFVINGIWHYLLGSITTGNPRLGEKASVAPVARRQLAVIAGLWMLSKAVGYWFDRYSLLNNRHDTFTGGSYTDINAVLPAKIVLLVIAIFVAALFFFTIVMRDLRIPALAVALMVVASLTVGVAWPAILEQFSVAPNRAEKEREYIARNIDATRSAYGIGNDTVTYEENWGATQGGAKAERSIAQDDTTLSNIRLLDPEVLSPTFTQQQQLRNFYGFPDELAIDRYQVDGEMRDFVVAARELNPNTLEGNQKDWINRHTVYTLSLIHI